MTGEWTLGDLPLAAGPVLPGVRLAYRVHGDLRAAGGVILYPTSYGAQSGDLLWPIGPGNILDTDRYAVVQIDMLGNGASTSPSQLTEPAPGLLVSHIDNVRAQERLLREHLGVERLALVYGWSMGAQQAYHWGAMFPDRVARIAALCGTARTSEHNRLFLMSLEAALTADPAWDGARFVREPDAGFRVFARIYASWAASQEFYRRREYLNQGYTDLDDYLARAWEPFYRKRAAIDHLAMLRTWMRNDLGRIPGCDGDLAAALGRIRARTLVMPSTSDLYFTPEDCAADAARIPGAVFRPIHSWRGHRAGNPAMDPHDAGAIRAAVHALLKDFP